MGALVTGYSKSDRNAKASEEADSLRGIACSGRGLWPPYVEDSGVCGASVGRGFGVWRGRLRSATADSLREGQTKGSGCCDGSKCGADAGKCKG